MKYFGAGLSDAHKALNKILWLTAHAADPPCPAPLK